MWYTHSAIGDLSDFPLIGRNWYVISAGQPTLFFMIYLTVPWLGPGRKMYVITSDPLTLLLVICLTVPWFSGICMWSLLIYSHCYWWSVLEDNSMWYPLIQSQWLLLVIYLTVPWLADISMWSLLIQSHCYWWSVWLFLDWQLKGVCDLCWSTQIVIDDLSDCSLTGSTLYVISADPLTLSDCSLIARDRYVISSDILTLLLVICLTVPWLAGRSMSSLLIHSHFLTAPWLAGRCMWSLLIHSHCYWWSVWLFLDWQIEVCESNHISMIDVSDCSLIGRDGYVISLDSLPLLLIICLTVPWLSGLCMWSLLIQSHCYWWSGWLFLDWQERVCDLFWSIHIAIDDLTFHLLLLL